MKVVQKLAWLFVPCALLLIPFVTDRLMNNAIPKAKDVQ